MGAYRVSVPRLCGVYYIPRPIEDTTTVNNFYVDLREEWLPVVALSSHSKINDSSSFTTLSQTFRNPSKTLTIPEAKYTFPLYENCAVSSFKCSVGDRVFLEGIVKAKGQAKGEYKEAVKRGENAVLFEQQDPDVFTTRIGNIRPGETIKVDIGYIMELKHDAEADGLRFTLPTSIAPRYGTPPPGVFSKENNVAEATIDTSSSGMTISVEIHMASNVRSVQSPSHPIALTLGTHKADLSSDQFNPKQAFATLSQTGTELGKDFYLIIACSDLSSPRAILETHNTLPSSKALMVTLVPKFTLPPGPKPEIVFVVDRSGSMEDKIGSLKSALAVFLKSLPVGVKFNICSFGSDHSFLWPQSKGYNADTLQEAQTHVSDFSANFGGTEILPPVQASIERRLKDIPLEIFVLTDGETWDRDALFKYVEGKTREGDVRVFSLGIGEDVSHSLVEGLARVGRGFAQIVGSSGEAFEGKVVRMLKGGLSTHVKNYRLEWDGRVDPEVEREQKAANSVKVGGEVKKISLFDEQVQTTNSPSPNSGDDSKNRFAGLPPFDVPLVLQAPYKIPPLFPFTRTTVYCILSGVCAEKPPTSVWLKGTMDSGDELELEIPVQVAATNDSTIHQLGARKILQELEEGSGHLHSGKFGVEPEQQPGQFMDWIEREGERVGVLYQIASKWTSFIAVQMKKNSSDTETDSGSENRTPMEYGDIGTEDRFEDYVICGDNDNQIIPEVAMFASASHGMMPKSATFHSSVVLCCTSSNRQKGSALADADDEDKDLGCTASDCENDEILYRDDVKDDGLEFRDYEEKVSHAAFELPHLSEPSIDAEDFMQVGPPQARPTPVQMTADLISLQRFDGSFHPGESLAAILGVEIDIFVDEEKMSASGMGPTTSFATLEESVKRLVWATALSVAMFEVNLKSEKDTWELVVEKALSWLENLATGITRAEVDIVVKNAGKNIITPL